LEASPIFAGSSAIFSVKACYFSQVNDPFSWSNPNLLVTSWYIFCSQTSCEEWASSSQFGETLIFRRPFFCAKT